VYEVCFSLASRLALLAASLWSLLASFVVIDRHRYRVIFSEMASSGVIGESPGCDDIAINGVVHSISGIADPVARLWVRHLCAARESQESKMNLLIDGQSRMADAISVLSTEIRSMHDYARSSPPHPLFPVMIHAASSGTSSSPTGVSTGKGSAASSRSNGRSSAGSISGESLHCPFCPASHTNEKSHWQHLDRLGKRIGQMYSGDCNFPPDYAALQHYAGTTGQKMLAFIHDYCSKISSSRDRGVDSGRAAALAEWLLQLQ
jgi:hypothetical protein